MCQNSQASQKLAGNGVSNSVGMPGLLLINKVHWLRLVWTEAHFVNTVCQVQVILSVEPFFLLTSEFAFPHPGADAKETVS